MRSHYNKVNELIVACCERVPIVSDFPDFSDRGYQVVRELGHNRAGGRVTYEATQLTTQQSVAIKQFQFTQTGANWSGYEAFSREIQVLRGLNFPSIPRYLGSFETPDGFCLVQEYIDAPSLATPRSFDAGEIKQIAIALLEILVYLQNRIPPVIHRDIKPENILVDDELKVYLVDFGFARIGDGEVAASSLVKGTLGFMPPEQLFNRQLTEASDLYGVGATLVCLLTGTKSIDIGESIDPNNRLQFAHLLPKVSLPWIRWLETMVQPNPHDRYANADAALTALKPIYVNRCPTVKLRPAVLEFRAEKLGQKLTQTIAISNSVPDTVLAGHWTFADHPKDLPHAPEKHHWIAIAPMEFESNQALCKVTVRTNDLKANKNYSRQLLLHSNASSELQIVTLKVRTAPVPVKPLTPPISWLAMLAIAGFILSWGYNVWTGLILNAAEMTANIIDKVWAL